MRRSREREVLPRGAPGEEPSLASRLPSPREPHMDELSEELIREAQGLSGRRRRVVNYTQEAVIDVPPPERKPKRAKKQAAPSQGKRPKVSDAPLLCRAPGGVEHRARFACVRMRLYLSRHHALDARVPVSLCTGSRSSACRSTEGSARLQQR